MADFLASNIIWVIVGAVILIMAIIGYFAENSELGKKVLGPKLNAKPKQKKNKKQKNSDLPVAETPAPADNMALNATVETKENLDPMTLSAPNPEVIGEVEPNISDDAWTNNVDTNVEKPTEVVEANPNEWLDGPIELSNEMAEPVENTEPETPSIEGSEDALFTMPGTSDILPEVPLDTLPETPISEVEILEIDDNNDFDNIEILTTDDEINPVEQTLANFDSNANNTALVEAPNENNKINEPVLETAADDIWK